ncbi:MAG: hypothetical protein L3J66_10890 [Bacteroidales bacterium]|nr:hypothetical protein [Bacteroidales bacterium]
MTKLKKIMVRSMSKIMLNCENATLLITKSEFEELGCASKMKLKMHLAGCRFCRNFSEQSNAISRHVVDIKTINPQKLRVHLSEEQKSRLSKTIKKRVAEN